MFEIGKNVMVVLVSGWAPAIYVGRVTRLIGFDGCELEHATMIKWCSGAKQGLAAQGDAEIRRDATYQYRGTIRFSQCSYAQDWAGKLPTEEGLCDVS